MQERQKFDSEKLLNEMRKRPGVTAVEAAQKLGVDIGNNAAEKAATDKKDNTQS